MLGITFRQLQVFVEVVDLGSFRACAERLGVGQVSVSGHVRAMERMIGRPLFLRRHGATAELTEDGQRMYGHAVLLLQQMQALMDDVSAPRDQMPRHRLIVAGVRYLSFRLTQVVAEFHLSHPDWQVEYEASDHASAADLVARGRADLGFMMSPVDRVPAGGVPVWRERLGLFVGRDHPLAARVHVPAAELSTIPLIYLPKRDALRGVVDGALAEAGVAGNPVAMQTANAMLARRTLMEGKVLGCLFVDLVRRDVERGTLVELRPERDLPPLEVSAFTSRRAMSQRAARALTALARGEMATADDRQVPRQRP